ncbi:MAG: transcriptional regulator [Rhizobiales bacterium 62-47]|nr:transcriptional regulator [Hyphomicrobiales bacterium]OJY14202.1 MAG: transcriptional regulator [Rhizobiales bacterium 62-47]
MPLTRTFKSTVKARATQDATFRAALLSEGVETLLSGDIQNAKSALRSYINATIGFESLARTTGTPPKSLMRMFGPRGNPSARNLSAVLKHLQQNAGFDLQVTPVRRNAKGGRK